MVLRCEGYCEARPARVEKPYFLFAFQRVSLITTLISFALPSRKGVKSFMKSHLYILFVMDYLNFLNHHRLLSPTDFHQPGDQPRSNFNVVKFPSKINLAFSQISEIR